MNRRDFGKGFMATAATVSLFEMLFSGCKANETLQISETNNIVATKATQKLNHWSLGLVEICNDLKQETLSPSIWQTRIEELFGQIELRELLQFIDFEKLSKNFNYPDLGVATRTVKFPKIDGLPPNTVFIKKIFGMKKGRAIVPHGHSNMASAHFILSGGFALRHYEKVSEESDSLLIRPTINKQISTGDYSSISDERDNVHWFVADTDRAFTFDVIMLDLGGKKYEIHNIDIDGGIKTGSGGKIRVRKIGVKTALQKYGKSHHI